MVIFIIVFVVIVCLGALMSDKKNYVPLSEQQQNELNRAKDYFNNPVVNEIRWNRYRDHK